MIEEADRRRVYLPPGRWVDPAEGSVAIPGGRLGTLRVDVGRLVTDPLAGRVAWRITRAPVVRATTP